MKLKQSLVDKFYEGFFANLYQPILQFQIKLSITQGSFGLIAAVDCAEVGYATFYDFCNMPAIGRAKRFAQIPDFQRVYYGLHIQR